jgi:pyruvate dehydrogenase E2 component (dihydrolipoamide acetyltransferase)
MAVPVTVPRLGWNMEEGVFAGWLKQDGDTVRPGDPLFSVESDKATEDVETLDGGVLRLPPDGPRVGDKLAVGKVIAYLVQPGESVTFPGGLKIAENVAKTDTGYAKEGIAAGPADRQPHGRPDAEPPHPAISPRARRVAAELDVDWTRLHGSGKSGRVRERDVRSAAERPASSAHLSPTRRIIAERMLRSARSTAPVTLTSQVDATNLVNLRAQFQIAGAAGGDPVPGYTDFFVKLAAVALNQHPALNARWENDRLAQEKQIHVGIAVDTEAGLLVPVVRDVPGLGLRQLAARSRDLVERARKRKLSAAEMQGSTFTVSSLGAFGIDTFSPVINYPEIAILGVGRVRRQPVAVGEQVVARDVVSLSLTFDHCAVDGAPAARFLQSLCKIVEAPGPWLLA